MIKQELYNELVNAHHEQMANIRSFAISGISDLNAPISCSGNYGYQLINADHTSAANSHCQSPWNDFRIIFIY
jgi:hypothetical protein